MKRYLKRVLFTLSILVLVMLALYIMVSFSFEIPFVRKKNVDVGYDENAINLDVVSSIVSEEKLEYTFYGCYNEYYLYMATEMPNWIYDLWMKPPWIYLLVDTSPKHNEVELVYFIGEDITISTAICEYVGSSEISINQVFD